MYEKDGIKIGFLGFYVGYWRANRGRINQSLKELKEQNKTVVVVHHDLQTVPDYFDWVTLINLRVVACGPVDEVFHEDNLKKTYHSSGALLRGVM